MKKFRSIDLRVLRESRLLKTQVEVSALELLSTPLDLITRSVHQKMAAELIKGVEKSINGVIPINEDSNLQRETKIFSSSVVFLTKEEFERIRETIAYYEKQDLARRPFEY